MTFWRRRKVEREQAQAEAEAALQESVNHLQATVHRGREVRKVAAELRRIQRDNHFADAIRHAYRGA